MLTVSIIGISTTRSDLTENNHKTVKSIQRCQLEICITFNADEFLSVDQLPAPKKIAAKPESEAPKPAPRREVGIADQIAIRSYVLAKSVGKSSD